MSETSVKKIRQKHAQIRKLLAMQMGIKAEELGPKLGSQTHVDQQLQPDVSAPSGKKRKRHDRPDKANDDESTLEECDSSTSVFTDSSTFLKGTQSDNPHNDYCQHFVDTGERPQNFIRDVGLANRFEEYPKLRELIRLKDELVEKTATPPMYLNCDLMTFNLCNLQNQFDVILIEPPLHEYQSANGIVCDRYWNWDEIRQLEIDKVASHRAFLWLWCGCDGLDAARECFKKWGFRRCEDICWIKSNHKTPGQGKNIGPEQVFQRTKEHCLMGIKGTVRRSTDGDFIHANVDIDLIIDEEPPYGSKEKPIELFHIIEHFCLGRRRLHIFGRDSTIRNGWLTIGPDVSTSNFDAETYRNFFNREPGPTTGCSDEIEILRPKSPPPKSQDSTVGDSNSGRNSNIVRGRGSFIRGGFSRGARGGRGRQLHSQNNRGGFVRGKSNMYRGGY